MKHLSIKIVLLSVIMLSDAVGMERPAAMGMARALADNCLVRTCSKCCIYECCPLVTIMTLTEAFACTCLLKQDFNYRCALTQGARLCNASVGAFLLGVIGATIYINKSTKRN